jgi:methyl-accepting chemotaxis protein
MADNWGLVGEMNTVAAEVVSFLQALKSGSPIGYLILLALVPVCLALMIVALVHQRIVIKRLQAASKAAQEEIEAIAAADLRRRALEVKEYDEDLRKREPEVKERDELGGSFNDANAELRSEPQRPRQQRALKGSQQALKESVSHTIALGFKDIQNRLLEADFKGMMAVPHSLKAKLQRKPDEGALKIQNRIKSLSGKQVPQ